VLTANDALMSESSLRMAEPCGVSVFSKGIGFWITDLINNKKSV
jgi:hypothetical protein